MTISGNTCTVATYRNVPALNSMAKPVALALDSVSLLFWLNPKKVINDNMGAAKENTSRYRRIRIRSTPSRNRKVTSPNEAGAYNNPLV